MPNEYESNKFGCTLEVTNLNQNVVSYLAVSNTWGPSTVNGTATPPTPITCNGQDILVPHNLGKALSRIRHRLRFADKKFWIDAISINQTDDEERSSQPAYGDRTVESAYISAAIQILKDSDDFPQLYCIEGRDFQYSPKLPSWVPDWRCEKAFGLRVTGYRRFNASGGLPRSLVAHESSRMLEFRARRIDVILFAGKAKHEINGGRPFLNLMGILKGYPSSVDEAMLNMVWRSLLTNTGGDPPQCPIDESYRRAFLHWIVDKLSVVSKSTPARETRDHEVLNLGRVSTNETSGGYTGVGSESLQEDDSVWIVPGSRVPLIFREDRPGHHRLVEGAYVHGLMHGEAHDLDGAMNQWETLRVL
ncbi:hypothetical protein LZ30DRAFT_687980 [Colletotrichum cereale]|nr:hypothetical protein LZ30DRAFT_687980 [Colletotrichum cereale]